MTRRDGEGARQQFPQAGLREMLVCSLLVLTEAGSREAEVVRRVRAAAGELARIGAECAEEKWRLEQL